MKISYNTFDYDAFFSLEKELKKKYPSWEIMLTSLEYKGTICATTIFIGKILVGLDPRENKTIPPYRFFNMLQSKYKL